MNIEVFLYYFLPQAVVNYDEIKNFIQQQVVKIFDGEKDLWGPVKVLNEWNPRKPMEKEHGFTFVDYAQLLYIYKHM